MKKRHSLKDRFTGKWIAVLCAATLVMPGVPFAAFGMDAGQASEVPAQSAQEDKTEQEQKLSSNDTCEEATASSRDNAEANEEGLDVSKLTDGVPSLSSAAVAAPLPAPAAAASSDKVGTLDVQLSNSSGDFESVDGFEGGITNWYLGDLRTMKVDFEFGLGTSKKVVIQVPNEYRIEGYSAIDGTPGKDYLKNIAIDPQYKGYFQSSMLMGADGTTAWESQVLPDPYLAQESDSEASVPVYGGVATYTFASDTTQCSIVMTLEPNTKMLSHTAEEELLDAVTVRMSSSQGGLSSSFQANITDLATPEFCHSEGVWGAKEANVPYDSETGMTDQFGVISSARCYNYDINYGVQEFYCESWVSTIHYPKGVSFDNKINCWYLGWGDKETASGELVPGHFSVEVTGDETTGGTVTFLFTDTYLYHSSGLDTYGAYFTANRNLVDTENLEFTVETTMHNRGKDFTYADTRHRDLMANSDAYLMDLSASNEYRRNIHADYPDYPYDYALGCFKLKSNLPYSNVHLSYDFSQLQGVRGIGAPGYNVHDITVTTTAGRTISLESVPGDAADTDSGYDAIPVTAEQLGLAESEYLVSLDCFVDMEQITYNNWYSDGVSYYGRFANGQEGDVVLSILDASGNVAVNNQDVPLIATDHTTIRWDNSGGQWMDAAARNDNGSRITTFHPYEGILFDGYLEGGCCWSDSDTLIDPIIMVSLPKGINLDTSSAEALSEFGNHPEEWISLKQVKTPKKMDIDGVEWTTYYFTSEDPLDMIAMESYPGQRNTGIEFTCRAFVAANAPEYGQLSLADCVQWDMNVTSAPSSDWNRIVDKDVYDRAGHGTNYMVHEIGENFTIKPLIGLNVDLGIRVKDSGTDFFTYDSTEGSVAPITPASKDNAEVRISYENTAASDYFLGSSIYLPIPKKGVNYSKFFQNIELKDPVNVNKPTTFEFTTSLASEVALPGFTTYYAVSANENATAYDPSTNASAWEPVNATWYTYSQLTKNGHSLADVVMMKLEATSDIPSGKSATATFELAVADGAAIGQVDYWRAYSKAVTKKADKSGVWNYSSVVAATPVSFGVSGLFFLDNDNDGRFNGSAGDEAYTAGNVTAILSREDGGMGNLLLSVKADGSFYSLNESGSTYYLKAGNYTVTFTNNDPVYLYSQTPGEADSNSSAWYNDIDPTSINGHMATYRFTVDEDSLGTYVGVALTNEVISIDVPVKVKLAVRTDGTWFTPTALDNYIRNNSTCGMRVASVDVRTASDFQLQSQDALAASDASNSFAGAISAQGGPAQDLTAIDTSDDTWTMAAGNKANDEDLLPLQLSGSIQNVENHYFTSLVHVFDTVFTFEKTN